MEMTFDDVLHWLAAHAEQRAQLSIGVNDGNTSVHVSGVLQATPNGEVVTIDARRGRIECWAVGDASLQLLEGDFEGAEAWIDDEEHFLTVHCIGKQHLLLRSFPRLLVLSADRLTTGGVSALPWLDQGTQGTLRSGSRRRRRDTEMAIAARPKRKRLTLKSQLLGMGVESRRTRPGVQIFEQSSLVNCAQKMRLRVCEEMPSEQGAKSHSAVARGAGTRSVWPVLRLRALIELRNTPSGVDNSSMPVSHDAMLPRS